MRLTGRYGPGSNQLALSVCLSACLSFPSICLSLSFSFSLSLSVHSQYLRTLTPRPPFTASLLQPRPSPSLPTPPPQPASTTQQPPSLAAMVGTRATFSTTARTLLAFGTEQTTRRLATNSRRSGSGVVGVAAVAVC